MAVRQRTWRCRSTPGWEFSPLIYRVSPWKAFTSRAENTTGLKLDTETTGSSKSGRGALSRRYMPDGNDRFRPREELMQA
jgi:hypothetical protein